MKETKLSQIHLCKEEILSFESNFWQVYRQSDPIPAILIPSNFMNIFANIKKYKSNFLLEHYKNVTLKPEEPYLISTRQTAQTIRTGSKLLLLPQEEIYSLAS